MNSVTTGDKGRTWEKPQTLYSGERKNIILLEGSYAPHVRPSDKNIVDVETLGWLKAMAWDRDHGILVL
jgi:hypothetical protein